MDDFKRPATAFLSFMALPRLTNASDSALAHARADSARAEIAAGTPFADVARRESADTASAEKGGDLGEWTKGSMDPAFDSAAFALPLKTVSKPVLSQFGYHLIEITSRSGKKAKGRHILFPIEVAGAHRDLLDARADSLERLAADRTERGDLDAAAKALALPVGKTAAGAKGNQGAGGQSRRAGRRSLGLPGQGGRHQPGHRDQCRLLCVPPGQPPSGRDPDLGADPARRQPSRRGTTRSGCSPRRSRRTT